MPDQTKKTKYPVCQFTALITRAAKKAALIRQETRAPQNTINNQIGEFVFSFKAVYHLLESLAPDQKLSKGLFL